MIHEIYIVPHRSATATGKLRRVSLSIIIAIKARWDWKAGEWHSHNEKSGTVLCLLDFLFVCHKFCILIYSNKFI